MKSEPKTYEVEERGGKRYTVSLERWGENNFKAECTCPENLYYRRWCDHIDKAITCFKYGF